MSDRGFESESFPPADSRDIPQKDAVELRREGAEKMAELCQQYYETGELPNNLTETFGEHAQNREIVTFVLDAFRGQMRKDGKTPLAVHSLMLGASAHQLEVQDPEVFPTSLLHDIAEDTELGIEDVRSRFGNQVASRANTMTEERTEGDRFDSIVHFVEKLKTGGPMIAKVELLDRRDDLLDLGYLTDKLQNPDINPDEAAKIRNKLGEKFAKCRWTIDFVAQKSIEEPEVARLKKEFDKVYALQQARWNVPEDVVQSEMQEYEARREKLNQ